MSIRTRILGLLDIYPEIKPDGSYEMDNEAFQDFVKSLELTFSITLTSKDENELKRFRNISEVEQYLKLEFPQLGE